MASTSAADRFQLCSDVVVNEIEGGSLVVNLETGKTWKLNRVGAAVCRGLERGDDLSSIAGEVAARYGVAVATVIRDMDALIVELRREGLVQPRGQVDAGAAGPG